MAVPSPPVAWAQYLALRGFAGFLGCFNVDQTLEAASMVGSAYWRFSRKHRERAKENIRLSFPEMTEEEVERTGERSVQHTLQLFMVDALVMPRLLTPASWTRYVRLGNLAPAINRVLLGEPTLLITGHCGNWELLGFMLSVLGYPIAAVARPLDNPLVNDWILGMREARGMQIITKFGATPELLDIMRRGGQIGFIADQNAGDRGLFVPFFGRLASSYKSIALLAKKYEVPIAAGTAVRRNQKFEYELFATDFITPDEWEDQPDPLFYITARYNRAMEAMIRTAPEQYLWMHRRWKSRPKWEREGKPMPGRFRDKLATLPWMTEGELERIVAYSNGDLDALSAPARGESGTATPGPTADGDTMETTPAPVGEASRS